MGANPALAMEKKQNGCRRRPALRLMFNLGNERTASSGLLFVRGT
jgi:hypothetical protein